MLGRNPELLRYIVSKTTDINATSNGQNALIILLSDDGCNIKDEDQILRCVEILCDNGIDPHCCDENNNTALKFAKLNNYSEIENYLAEKLKALATPNKENIFVCLNYLKVNEEDNFRKYHTTLKSEVVDTILEKTFLQIACTKNLIKVVDYLINVINVDPSGLGSINKTPPFILAMQKGNKQIIEYFLKIQNFKLPDNTIFEFLKPIPWNGLEENNLSLFQLIFIESYLGQEFVNKKNDKGNYALHHAIKYNGKKTVQALLRAKASLANRNKLNILTITDIDYGTLKAHLDSCICMYNQEANHKFGFKDMKHLCIDYRTLLPSTEMDIETGAILYMANNSELKPLLSHPVIDIFLTAKWHKTKNVYYINSFLYLALCAIWIWYSWSPSTWLYFLLWITVVLRFFKLIFHLYIKVKKYGICAFFEYIYMETYIGALMLVAYCTFLIGFYQKPMFAIASISACVRFLFLFGFHPNLHFYIIMLKTVTANFVKVFSFFFPLILTFALSFHLLFENSDKKTNMLNFTNKTTFFENYSDSLLRTLVMFCGEIGLDSLAFNEFPIWSRIIFITFLFFISVILMNLVTGLAINDALVITKDAKIYSLIKRAENVAFIEMVSLNKYMSTVIKMLILPNFNNFRYLHVYPNYKGEIRWIASEDGHKSNEPPQSFAFYKNFFNLDQYKFDNSTLKEAESIIEANQSSA